MFVIMCIWSVALHGWHVPACGGHVQAPVALGAEVPTGAECITAAILLLLFKKLFVNVCMKSGACRLPVWSAVLCGWQAQGPVALGIEVPTGWVPLLLLSLWLSVNHV
jgi:hypothetical protein